MGGPEFKASLVELLAKVPMGVHDDLPRDRFNLSLSPGKNHLKARQ